MLPIKKKDIKKATALTIPLPVILKPFTSITSRVSIIARFFSTQAKMLPVAIQPSVNCSLNFKLLISPSSFPNQKLVSSKSPKPFSLQPCKPNMRRTFTISASSAVTHSTIAPDSISSNPPQKQVCHHLFLYMN